VTVTNSSLASYSIADPSYMCKDYRFCGFSLLAFSGFERQGAFARSPWTGR